MQRITASGHQETFFNNGTCNSNIIFNGTEGVITTPGYPSDLDFSKSCFCNIDVGGGKIEVTIETVSLPDGSRVGIHGIVFTVGVHFLQTRVVYVPSDRAPVFVFVGSNTNLTDAYGGVKLLYRRISDDVCKADYTAHYFDNTIKSLGFPQSLKVDSTCVYSIHAFNKGNVVHIGFEDFSFGPNDVFTIYDYANNSIIYGPLTRHQSSILTEPTKSASIKIVIVTNVTSSVKQSYAISFKEVPKDTCLKEYYEGSGLERRVSSAAKSCSYIIRPERYLSRVVVWFESLTISEKNFVTVSLMFFSDKLITYYNLSSNSSRRSKSFDGLNRGNWFEIRQSADVTFDLKFKTYSGQKCPFYLIADRVERKISSPGYPDPFPSNSSCEYYIRSRDQSSVVYIRFTEELLSPGDKIAFYDPSDGSIIAKYDGTLNEELSVTTKSASVRIVFTFGKTKPGQLFWFYYKMIPSDSCVVDYKSTIGQFSSFNRSCEYNIYLANNLQIEMKFDNLLIPANRFIKLVQKQYLSDRPLENLKSNDSGKTKYFRSKDLYNVISISADPNVVFHVSFQPFIKDRAIYVYASNGTLLSPNYPNSYLFEEFEPFTLTFHVKIPYGHVLLNFTEVMLSASTHFGDYINIYDGNTTSAERLGIIQVGNTKKLPAVFLASSNYFTVQFGSYSSYNPEKLYRFKAVYTTVKNVSFCKPIQWLHSHAERNLTLPGRKTKFLCDKGYENKQAIFRDVTRTCGFDGDWEDGDNLVCLKMCPRLDNKLKENSSLDWFYSTLFLTISEGGYVTFFCNYKEELVGPKQIWCTSYGTYSSIPPVCKKKTDSGSVDVSSGAGDGWKYGVGFGGAAFIIGIVLAVLRVCFGCFACCAENSSANSISMSEVKYSSP